MPRIRPLLLCLPLLLTACSAAPPLPPPPAEESAETAPVSAPQPEQIIAAWIPYFSVSALLSDPDEAVCREHVSSYLQLTERTGKQILYEVIILSAIWVRQ